MSSSTSGLSWRTYVPSFPLLPRAACVRRESGSRTSPCGYFPKLPTSKRSSPVAPTAAARDKAFPGSIAASLRRLAGCAERSRSHASAPWSRGFSEPANRAFLAALRSWKSAYVPLDGQQEKKRAYHVALGRQQEFSWNEADLLPKFSGLGQVQGTWAGSRERCHPERSEGSHLIDA